MNRRLWKVAAMLVALSVVCACSAPTPVVEPEDIPPEKDPDVVFVPTPQDVVDLMLHMARVDRNDLVLDLGCGDGRVVVTAAKRYGCRATGYDIDPERVQESRQNVRQNGVGHLVRIEQKDIFTLDLSPANVVFLYLLPDLNVQLIPQLEKLRPGTRIVSHEFDMKGVRPDVVLTMVSREDDDEHQVYMWTAPLRHEPADGPAADGIGIPRLEELGPPLPREQEQGTRKVSPVGKP